MNGFLINNTISKNISFLCDDLNFDINGKVIFNGKELNPLELIEKMNNLEKKVEDISLKINEIYYAPGMPGYLQAQESYNNTLKKRKLD